MYSIIVIVENEIEMRILKYTLENFLACVVSVVGV